jgi:hypothetical protein
MDQTIRNHKHLHPSKWDNGLGKTTLYSVDGLYEDWTNWLGDIVPRFTEATDIYVACVGCRDIYCRYRSRWRRGEVCSRPTRRSARGIQSRRPIGPLLAAVLQRIISEE